MPVRPSSNQPLSPVALVLNATTQPGSFLPARKNPESVCVSLRLQTPKPMSRHK